MPTRRAATGRWLSVAVVLGLCLGVTPASAQNLPPTGSRVPDTTIQRIAEINTQLTELTYLYNTSQLTGQPLNERRAALEAELGTLKQQLRQFPVDEQRRAEDAAQGLTKARLALL